MKTLTKKEFIVQWGQEGHYDKKLESDLDMVIKDEIEKFVEWYNKYWGSSKSIEYIESGHVENYFETYLNQKP